ncbi:MAG TPA: glycosyltransferase family 4 protein [Dehalococcoidia bacterium]|nr:glycosyltransferase family 4 protein [Dehalococcoidia bacterium]
MRVLQVNKFLYPAGGSETVMFQTASLLESYGHEVRFFGMQDDRNTVSMAESQLVSNVDYSGGPSGAGRWLTAARFFHSREAAQKLEAVLDEWRPDVAHLHNIYHQISPSILEPLKRHGVPVVMTLHDYKLICPNYSLHTPDGVCERCKGGRFYNAVLQGCVKGSRLSSVICAVEAYAHRATGVYNHGIDALVAPSHFMKQKLTEFGWDAERIEYLPNFLDVDAFEPAYAPEPYFVFAGRLERVKGVATLLEAIAVSETARSVELRIAGDGPELETLKSFAHAEGLSRVRFLGRLSRYELQGLLRSAICAVVPSDWYENAPMSVLEAYACGTPVVASHIGGLPELVHEGETGLLFQPGNSAELRGQIELLLSRPDLAIEMGRAARSLAEERFGPRRHYEHLLQIYDLVLHRTEAKGSVLATKEAVK